MNKISTTIQWREICALEDIPARGARRLRLGDKEVAIFRTARNEVYAINNLCPHKGGPLSEGIVHDTAVTCPLHSMVIDLTTGVARGEDRGCVQTYPVEVRESGKVYLGLQMV